MSVDLYVAAHETKLNEKIKTLHERQFDKEKEIIPNNLRQQVTMDLVKEIIKKKKNNR